MDGGGVFRLLQMFSKRGQGAKGETSTIAVDPKNFKRILGGDRKVEEERHLEEKGREERGKGLLPVKKI